MSVIWIVADITSVPQSPVPPSKQKQMEDHTYKRGVRSVPRSPVPPLKQTENHTSKSLDDYLDEKESKQWLTDNDYQLSKDTDGRFILQKQRPGFHMNRKLGGTTIGMQLENGVTLSLIDGKIRIKIKKD